MGHECSRLSHFAGMLVVTSCQEKHISTPPLSPVSSPVTSFGQLPLTSDDLEERRWSDAADALLRAYLDDMILNDLRDRKRIDIRPIWY